VPYTNAVLNPKCRPQADKRIHLFALGRAMKWAVISFQPPAHRTKAASTRRSIWSGWRAAIVAASRPGTAAMYIMATKLALILAVGLLIIVA
jgi:hypothetical protein